MDVLLEKQVALIVTKVWLQQHAVPDNACPLAGGSTTHACLRIGNWEKMKWLFLLAALPESTVAPDSFACWTSGRDTVALPCTLGNWNVDACGRIDSTKAA